MARAARRAAARPHTCPPAVAPGPAVILLPEALDLPAAGPLAAELAARRGTDVDLDASRVSRLGAQPLQVLLAALACWRADGATLRVAAASPGFAEGLELLGAADLLPCHAAA